MNAIPDLTKRRRRRRLHDFTTLLGFPGRLIDMNTLTPSVIARNSSIRTYLNLHTPSKADLRQNQLTAADLILQEITIKRPLTPKVRVTAHTAIRIFCSTHSSADSAPYHVGKGNSGQRCGPLKQPIVKVKCLLTRSHIDSQTADLSPLFPESSRMFVTRRCWPAFPPSFDVTR